MKAERPEMTDTPERDVDITETVSCPSCGSLPGEPCEASGVSTRPHRRRLTTTIHSLRAQLRDARAEAWDDASAEIERKISALKQWQSLLPRDSSVIDKLQARVEILEDVALTFRSRAQQQIGAETKP